MANIGVSGAILIFVLALIIFLDEKTAPGAWPCDRLCAQGI